MPIECYIRLFQSYCSTHYGSSIWPLHDRGFNDFCVTLNKGMLNVSNRPLSRRLDRCDRVIQKESGDPNGGNMCSFSWATGTSRVRHNADYVPCAQIRFDLSTSESRQPHHRLQWRIRDKSLLKTAAVTVTYMNVGCQSVVKCLCKYSGKCGICTCTCTCISLPCGGCICI